MLCVYRKNFASEGDGIISSTFVPILPHSDFLSSVTADPPRPDPVDGQVLGVRLEIVSSLCSKSDFQMLAFQLFPVI